MESGSEEEIDIQYTDWESETDPTASESDEAFIDYENEPIEMEDYDSSYVPTESEEVASFTSASDYGETFDDVRTPLLVDWPAIDDLRCRETWVNTSLCSMSVKWTGRLVG
jgi:hypothetical protein